MNEILELLEKHGVQMTGERHGGRLCCAVRKGAHYCMFQVGEGMSVTELARYYLKPAIESMEIAIQLEAEAETGA